MSAAGFQEKLSVVQSFFSKWVDKYIVGDLEVLLGLPVPATDEEGGGCSAPLAMVVFSGMDLLGYLTRRGLETDRKDRMHPNIKHFCNEWMKYSNKQYQSEKLQEAFIHLFRCGAAHHYFPIGIHITRQKCDELLQPRGQALVLCTQVLGEDFKKAVKDLSAKVAKGANEALVDTIYDKLMRYKDEYTSDLNSHLSPVAEKVVSGGYPDLGPTVGSGDLTSTTLTTQGGGMRTEPASVTTDWGLLFRQQDVSKDRK